jgi:O-antigen ligase
MLTWLTYGILCALLFVLTRKRAGYGLGALIIATPFHLTFAFAQTTVTIPKLFVMTILAALATRGVSDLRRLLRMPLWLAVCTLVLATAATWTSAIYHDAVARETGKTLLYALTLATGYWCYRRDPDRQLLLASVTIGVAIVAIGALAQEWSGAPSVFASTHGIVPRIAGALEGPNQCAGYFDITLSWLIAQSTFHGVNDRRWLRRAAIGSIFLGVLTLFLTFSRGGIVATSATAILLFSLRGTWGSPACIAWLCASVAGFGSDLLLAHGGAHLFSVTDSGDTGALGHRSDLWRAALFFWKTHPLLGIGAGNYERELALAGYPKLHDHANSLYLQSLAEGGIVLFASILAIFATIFTRFGRAFQQSALAAGALASTMAFALHQSVDFLMFYPKVAGLWWILLGCGLGECTGSNPTPLNRTE